MVPILHMNQQLLSKLTKFVPLVIFAFVVCGVGSMYCPMPASAADTHHHSQPSSHHSSSSQTTGECPEQLTTSAGTFENDDVSVEVLSVATVSWLHDIPRFGLFKFLGNERTPHSTTHPLLFILFSVFLN
jgi:hypothetical protein